MKSPTLHILYATDTAIWSIYKCKEKQIEESLYTYVTKLVLLQLHFLTLVASRRFYILNLSYLQKILNFCTNLSRPKLYVPIYFKLYTWKSSNFHMPYNQLYLQKMTIWSSLIKLYLYVF